MAKPGRPKGAKNKRNFNVEVIASRFALDPFEILMMIAVGDWKGLGFEEKTKTTFTMNGIEVEEENIPIRERCNAAKEATRYLYTQKHSLTHEISDDELKELLKMKLANG